MVFVYKKEKEIGTWIDEKSPHAYPDFLRMVLAENGIVTCDTDKETSYFPVTYVNTALSPYKKNYQKFIRELLKVRDDRE